MCFHGLITQKSSKRNGTEGRTRTDTELPQPDFESGASTNFATPAHSWNIIGFYLRCNISSAISNDMGGDEFISIRIDIGKALTEKK